MPYARWSKEEEIKSVLEPVSKTTEIKTSGLPVMYDETNLYIDSRDNHSMIIGSSGSGKTQAIVLPMLELSRRASESVIVCDPEGEIYRQTQEDFTKSGYQIVKVNFNDPKNSNCWNPLDLISQLYQADVDKAQELIESLGYYLLNEDKKNSTDPFWINTAIDYFTGITLYALKNDNQVNLNKIMAINFLIQENPKDFIQKIDKTSDIYLNLNGTLNAPSDTRGGIFSTFDQKIKKYISRENLSEMMAKSDRALANINATKTIIYVQKGHCENTQRLLSLFISQMYFALANPTEKPNKRLNIIIDEFEDLYPLQNFAMILKSARSHRIIFTIIIQGFYELQRYYHKDDIEMIKIYFTNIMYLLSGNLDTLKEISCDCGNILENNISKPLITIEELQTLKMFEAVYLTTRMMPFKTKLLPFYEIKN